MTIALVVAFAVIAAADWWLADQEPRPALRPVTKLVATALLIVLAATAGEMDSFARFWLVAAVALCFAGDALLLGNSEQHFLAGLGAFAFGHLCYVVTALFVGVSIWRMWPAAIFLVALLGFRLVSQTIPGARRVGGQPMAVAVGVYAAVISLMVLGATGTGSWAAAVGAMLFAVSDWIIGYTRFVRRIPHDGPAVMATYHVGQLLLIAGLIAAG